MKKLITALCFAFLGFSLFAYNLDIVGNIKGEVKSVTRTDYTISSKFGDYFRTPNLKTVYKFDSKLKIVESAELSPRDALINKITNTYDVLGNVITTVCSDSENNQLWSTTFTYKDGIKTEYSEFDYAGALKNKTIFSYKDGILSEESYYNGEGNLIWKIIYKYNENGQIESEDEYSGSGTLDEARRYVYTETGKNDSISYYFGNGSLKLKDVFRYSPDGNLSEITTYDSNNKVVRRDLVKVDSFGNLSKVTSYIVTKKFGQTVNEMVDMKEFVYDYNTVDEN